MKTISILLIEDNAADRYLFDRQLQETGIPYTLFQEKHGKSALAFFERYEVNKTKYPEEYPPLLVFLDINMPVMDGFGFLEKFSELRSQTNSESSIILMLTSSLRDTDQGKSMRYDFVKSYLQKGEFSAEDLRQEILKLVPEAAELAAP